MIKKVEFVELPNGPHGGAVDLTPITSIRRWSAFSPDEARWLALLARGFPAEEAGVRRALCESAWAATGRRR